MAAPEACITPRESTMKQFQRTMLHLQLQASEMCQIWHLQEGSARQALVQRQEGGLCSVAVGGTVMAVQRGVLHMQVGREPVARAQ